MLMSALASFPAALANVRCLFFSTIPTTSDSDTCKFRAARNSFALADLSVASLTLLRLSTRKTSWPLISKKLEKL